MGLFDSSHMPYNIDSDHAAKPTLAEMVGKALDVLEKDQKGYFLFVEGNVMIKGVTLYFVVVVVLFQTFA